MTTTDAWREIDERGTIHLHRSLAWVLVEIPSALHSIEWRLFGPGAPGERMGGGGNSPALDLLLASRAADDRIAEIGDWTRG